MITICETIHGESTPPTKEYSAWANMKGRCLRPTHPKYASYGGRGITVCAEWLEDYAAFLAHVGRAPSPRHTLGRIRNEQGYEPGNVRWETMKEQANNTRTNVAVEYDSPLGVMTLTLAELARLTGVDYTRLYERIVLLGWSVAEAVKPAPQPNGNARKVLCPTCRSEYSKQANGARYCRRCKTETDKRKRHGAQR